MRTEKPLEQSILDRFFTKLADAKDFPPETLEHLLQLRREDTLRNAEKLLQAIKAGKKSNV